jgi:hypothetical protein
MNAEIYDFTAAALHRRWLRYDASGEYFEAATLSHLIFYYLEGVMQVDWKEGDPYFSLSDHGRSLYDTISPDDEESWSNEGVQLGLFDGAFEDDN